VLRSLGFVVTLTALVIGFLVSSAKAYYAEVEQELTEISADVAALDQILAHAGPQADPARVLLRQLVGSAVRTVWPHHATSLPRYDGASGLDVSGSASVAGTTLALRGRLAPDAHDHWEIDTRAADLAQWSPLLQLVQPAGKPALALAGAFDGEARFDGRWPQLASQGQVVLKDGRGANLQLARAALRWSVSTAAQAPLEVQAEIDQLVIGMQRLDTLRLTVQGSLADHRIALSAASPVRPPKWIDLLQGADSVAVKGRAPEAATGTLVDLRAQGALQFDPASQQPLRWHGQVQQVDAARRGGVVQAPWFHITATELDAQYDPLSRTPRVTVSPGRAELPSLALRWSRLLWQGGSTPLVDVQAEVEPFSVAPLLARLQPDFGWTGDLVVAGQLRVHSTPSFIAEIEFGRQSGDLSVTDEAGTQALELTDLRLALDAHEGVWNFTQALSFLALMRLKVWLPKPCMWR